MTERIAPGRASDRSDRPSSAELYDRVAMETASLVIRRYSTSFGMAARLLAQPVRQDIENIYALVRLADEVVDGVAASASLEGREVDERLTALENQTLEVLHCGYSTNLIVHAFGCTARRTGIDATLIEPFFRSMRADIHRTQHTRESFDDYVYGSAEVVGLMCLAAFLRDEAPDAAERARLENGARHLGAAFQKINFLRDLAADFGTLGRSYLPGVDPQHFDERQKRAVCAEIDVDLLIARSTVAALPASSRRAVALAQLLFDELARRLRDTPASVLMTTRIRVPNPVKMRLAAAAAVGRLPRERAHGGNAIG
jgi:phytoene/squalene synthetase